MKKTFLIVSLMLTQAAMADSMSDKSNQKMNPMVQDTGMMNTSARPDLQGTGWYARGSALFWQAQVDGARWAYGAKDGGVNDSSLDITNVHAKDMDFNWDWGFNVGVGYNMDYDGWDTQLSYTWFQTRANRSCGVPQNADINRENANGVTPLYNYINMYTTGSNPLDTSTNKNSSIVWNIHYSMFDWDLGRAYNISKNLIFRPSVGVKGGWIHQDLKTTTHSFAGINGGSTILTQNTHQKNDFWGVGPTVNVNTVWALGQVDMHMFDLFGDLGGGLLYGNYRTHLSQTDSQNGDIRIPVSNHALVTPMMRMMMGFGWHVNFNQDAARFGLKLGYELQYWFTQNQFVSGTGANFGKALAFQGGTLEVRFDF